MTRDFTTLADAAAAEATVCVQDGTYIKTVVQARFPQANYTLCPSLEDCFQALQNEECVLYVDDELALRYRAAVDPSLELTREQFNSQYLMWPMREDLPPLVAKLIKKWMYRAIGNATMDQLYKTYFEKHTCQHGTAGEHCELPCDPDHGTADGTGACICHSTKWTGFDCSMEVPEELNLIPVSLVRTGYALAGINVCLVLFCAVWLCWQRRRAQVQMAQPSFLSLILLGCLISTSTIIDMAQQDAGDGPVYACMAIPWGYSVGFCITFGALFARIRKVYILVKSAAQMKRVRVSVMETLQIVGGVLLIDVSILVVWSAVDPLRWNRQVISEDQFGNALESVGSCGSEHWAIFAGIIAVFHLLLMSGACYMCFVSRKIPDRVSNGKFVGIAMVSNFQILLCAAPILLVLGSDPVANFVVRSVAIFMNDFVVVCLVFGPLVFKVKRFDHQTRRAVIRINSQEPINDGIKHYAQRVGRKRTEKERRRLMEQRAQRVTEITVVETSAEPMDQSSEQARSEDGLGGHAMPEPLPSEAQDLSMKVEEDALAEEEEEIVFESFSAESMDEGLLDSDDEEGNGSLSSCLQEDSDPKEPLADSGDCMYSCTAELDASFESESCSVPSNDIEDGRNHDDEVQDSRETPTAREP
ncbi:acid type B receptor subunit 2 [Seminavis robusta]|uniref:Acid type B receptor subunit 2 n=1 Tax=Seminavis robusta TaxID=568900 RepID=A0A9N8E2F2_9STRA|nr:acid type B receptor subunit 2 [Seminavis robusta]|eukprot:Sro548_g164500.1 acid type B receptor subunit 2 (644) ;mRNA; f:57708-59700